MVFLQAIVAYNIIINQWVSFRSEVPWFFFWVIWSVFETWELILKVKNVVCLFISQCSILILSKHIYIIIILLLSCISFNWWIFVNLSYRIIPCLLSFNFFTCNLNIWICLTLEIILDFNIFAYILFPIFVVCSNREKYFIRSSLSYFLFLCCKKWHSCFKIF
jgi:hypothetical protein